jgi:asparagine synthetase B (glutamine-hydrolysing)
MCEKMLNKREVPERENMELYCGYMAEEFHRLNIWLAERAQTSQKITFPYGKHYGWVLTHRKGQKLIYQLFPEKKPLLLC